MGFSLPEVRYPDERDNVFAWKVAWMIELGLDEIDAFRLAELQVDVHALADLVAAGCPLSVAIDIVI